MNSTNDQAIAAPRSRGVRSFARRATSRASPTTATTSTSANATRATQPSVPKLIVSTSRRTEGEGASHPSCPASSSIPRVGSWVFMKGSRERQADHGREAHVRERRMEPPAARGPRHAPHQDEQQRDRARGLHERAHREDGHGRELAGAQQERERTRHGEADQHVVVAARHRVEDHHGVQRERRHAEGRALGPDAFRGVADHPDRRERRGDRDQPERVDHGGRAVDHARQRRRGTPVQSGP